MTQTPRLHHGSRDHIQGCCWDPFFAGLHHAFFNAPPLIPGGKSPPKTAEGIPREAFNIKIAGDGPVCPDLGSAIH
jgi:hypothetical protein